MLDTSIKSNDDNLVENYVPQNMVNFEREAQPYDDNLAKNYVPPNMINFEREVRSTMVNFKKCTEELKFDDNHFMSYVVQLVEKERDKFRKFAKDSIRFSNYLANYSTDILFFSDCFKNDRYSNDDILELLDDLLSKSKENQRLFKELKNILVKKEEVSELEDMNSILMAMRDDGTGNIGISERLKGINEQLVKYVDIIEKDFDTMIDPDKKFKISDETTQESSCEGNSGPSVVFSGALIALAIIAVPELLVVSWMGKNFANWIANRRKRVQLNLKRNELIEKIKLFNDNLLSVITQINEIDIFWEDQVERIDHLITNLKGFNENKRIKQARIVNNIENKWKHVEKECQIYSKAIRSVLNSDLLLSVNTTTPLIL